MFSIIIPLYNKQDSIAATVNSIINQDFQEFEIIIINDGSTDNSKKVALSIKDSRIRVIDKANGGVSSARNKGIEVANYDWIAFLDGDDLWEYNHLSTCKDLILQYPGKKVFVTSFRFSTDVVIKSDNNSSYQIRDYFGEAARKTLIWTSVVVINKSCFNNVSAFNESYTRGEDIELWGRLSKTYEIIKSNKVTAVYMLDAENRACRNSSNLSKSVLKDISLNSLTGTERNYYKKLILGKIAECIKNYEFKNTFHLILKHNLYLLR